ncbi:MAG: hypothetical protein AAF725_27230, partial [Acidobacteriota bacterium]
PAMNGLMFEQIPVPQAELAARALADFLALALIAFGSLLAIRRAGGRSVLLGLLLVNVSLLAVSSMQVRQETAAASELEEASSPEARSLPRPLRFSKEQPNVLLIFLDRFMGGFVERILAEEPELSQRLQGFTWYPLTVAAGENSIAGLHPLLGGYDYIPRAMSARDLPLRDVSTEAYKIMPYNFTQRGYEANVVNPRGLGFTLDGDCSFLEMDGVTCSHISLEVTRRLAEEYGIPLEVLSDANYANFLALLGLMRSTPYVIKEVMLQRGPWAPILGHSAGSTFHQWAELKSLPDVTDTGAEKSQYNSVFNILPHEPYFMSKDCRVVPEPEALTVEELAFQGYSSNFEWYHAVAARCTLLLVADYFDWMRAQGIYDNTKIVMASDHGIVGESMTDRSSRAVAGGTTDSIFVRTRSVLFVKDREAREALAISEEFLPNAEVPRILCEEIGGCVNPFLDDRPIEAFGRDDPFIITFVPWQFNQQDPTKFVINDEMMLIGKDPYRASNWRRVHRDR